MSLGLRFDAGKGSQQWTDRTIVKQPTQSPNSGLGKERR